MTTHRCYFAPELAHLFRQPRAQELHTHGSVSESDRAGDVIDFVAEQERVQAGVEIAGAEAVSAISEAFRKVVRHG